MDTHIIHSEASEPETPVDAIVDIAQDAQEALDTAEQAEETAEEALQIAESTQDTEEIQWRIMQDEMAGLRNEVQSLRDQWIQMQFQPEPEAAQEVPENLETLETPVKIETAIVEEAEQVAEKSSRRTPQSKKLRLFGL